MDLIFEEGVKEELFESMDENSKYLDKFKDMISLALKLQEEEEEISPN